MLSHHPDLPDGKAVGGLDEWNTTSKSKSKKVHIRHFLSDITDQPYFRVLTSEVY